MVLTCSMATNNNQDGEPCTTALKRQIQTLASAIECLTKQTTTWKNSCAKGTLGPIISERSKRVPSSNTLSKGEIEKDQKAAT